MSEFLRQAFAGWDCVYVCGQNDFWPRLQAVLAFQNPQEAQIWIAGEWVGEPARGARIVPDAERSREMAVRAALRQDPDCLLVDQGDDVGSLLLQAALTGHRVIAGFPGEPRQALQSLLGEHPQLGETQCRSLFFDPQGLLLYRPESDQFERVSLWKQDGFEDLVAPEAPVASPPYQAPALTIPAEWGESRPLLPGLSEKFAGLARTCYAPLLGDFPQAESLGQFGGAPRLAAGEEWPCCGACGQRLHLICELDLSRVPEAAPLPANGWLQLFYCTAEACNHPAAWEPFSNNSLVRVLPDGSSSDLPLPSPEFRPRSLLAWEALPDFPHSEERPALDEREQVASYNLEEPGFLEHFGLQDPADRDQAAAYFRNHHGDKLLGWPAWSQGAEYPPCPQCARPMQMFLQINNDGYPDSPPGSASCHGQIFAADGNGHVFVCPLHQELTFAWACG